MKNVDVTVNITAHAEGLLLHKTLRSLRAGIKRASSKGIDVECNISLDNPTPETERILEKFLTKYFKFEMNIYRPKLGDLGKSRNYLIGKSHGKYIAFFDGDDFFTENYLTEAFQMAEKNEQPAIYSPKYLISFEGDNYLIEKLDENSFPLINKYLLETNYYISQVFAPREVFERIKYKPNIGGYGMEDWHFSCEAVAQGVPLINIPGTIFFYRRKKSGSLLAGQIASSATIRPSKLFSPKIYKGLPAVTSSPTVPQSQGSALTLKFKIIKKLENYELLNHYSVVQYNLHKNIAKALKSRYLKTGNRAPLQVVYTPLPERLRDIGFTEELVREWAKLNMYEPLIRASLDVQNLLPIVAYPKESMTSELYYELCQKYSEIKFTDLVLVPHIVRGGADLAAIRLVTELAKNNSKVIVMTTLEVESPWLNVLENIPGVVCVESNVMLRGQSEEQKINLIMKIIQGMNIKRLSIVNAELGYKIVTRHHKALQDINCSTFLHTYAFNMTEDGFIFNWIANGLVEAYDGVSSFVTDSEMYRREIIDINGFSGDRVSTLYLPLDKQHNIKTSYTRKNRVLWASRVSSDKLPEILIEVGRLLSEKGIELDIYGSLDKEYALNGRFERAVNKLKGVNYKGSYDGFSSLDTNLYDMFLLTTKNEGMPNVVLEACSNQIFVVAPSVGGIPECVKDGYNGKLVVDKFKAEAYAKAILDTYEGSLFSNSKVIKSKNSLIQKRHSKAAYTSSVRELMGLSGTTKIV